MTQLKIGQFDQEALTNEIEKTRNSLTTDRLDMSFGEIMSMYERKEIIIAPEFQRLFRWSNYQQTRFIESILLGIPIPPIFVAEDKDGRWELVDGLQRMSTILSFFGILESTNPDIKKKNNWQLGIGDLIKSFETMSQNELPLKFQLNIKRYACRVEIIKWNSNYDMRFELFNRLNTGGSPLTDQEIRNCIYRGTTTEFNDYLKRVASRADFIKLVNPTEKQLAELYPEELVLRFTSLYRNWNNVESNISQHMTNFMKNAVHTNSFNYSDFENILVRSIKVISPFVKDPFKGKKGGFSTSLYDSILVGVAENIEMYENAPSELVVSKINQLKANKDFQALTGSQASSRTRIIRRLEISSKLFEIV